MATLGAKLFRTICIVALAFANAELYAGEVETSEEKPPAEITVVPVGFIEWDMSSVTWGGLFGAIGVLLENAMAGEENSRTSRSLSEMIETSVRPRTFFAEQLTLAANECGISAVNSTKEFSTDVKFSVWGDVKSMQGSYQSESAGPSKYYVEAGLNSFWIDKNIYGTFLQGRGRIKFFDPSGKYLDYFTDYSGLSGPVRLNSDPGTATNASVQEIQDATKKVIEGLAANLGKKICSFRK
jgi:hypothetical protein